MASTARSAHGDTSNLKLKMKNTNSLKSLLLSAIAVLGLTAAARADSGLPEAKPAPAPVTDNFGLLGQAYATLSYGYTNLDGTSTHGDDYAFTVNQPLAFGLDGVFSYDYAQTGVIGGSRVNQQTLAAGLRAFSASYNWGKPYVEAGVGYSWARFAGAKDNSFVWNVAVGAEFQAAPGLTFTPYVRYVDAPDLASRESWNVGVKGNYWVNTSWAVTAGLERNGDKDTTFTVGTNFRF